MENNFVEGLENNVVLVLFYSGSQVYHPLYVIQNDVVNSNLLWLPAANFKQLVLPMNKITLYLHSYYDRSLQIHLCIGSCTIHPYSYTQSWQLYYMGHPAHIRRYLT